MSESDPKRLFDDGADDLSKSLLRAGRTVDVEQARRRKLAILGAAGAGAAAAAAVGTTSGAKGALQVVGAATLKWLGIGMVAAAVATGGAAYLVMSGAEPEKRPDQAAQAAAAESSIAPGGDPSNPLINDPNAAALSPPSGAPAAEEMAGEAPLPAGEARPGSAPKTALPASPAANTGQTNNNNNTTKSPEGAPGASASGPGVEAASAGENLTDEVMTLKRAREALAAGRPKRALIELNIYDKRFRGGRLSLEAEVLRIEAMAQSGDGKAAAARASSFLAAHPSSPYANRVRAIAEGSKQATGE